MDHSLNDADYFKEVFYTRLENFNNEIDTNTSPDFNNFITSIDNELFTNPTLTQYYDPNAPGNFSN